MQNAETTTESLPIGKPMLGEGTVTRKEIEALMQAKKEAIATLKQEINDLYYQSLLLSDEEQWFTEQMETITYRENRKKVQVQKLIGRIHWNENFKDEDTGEVITIKRCQVVRVDGKWDW